MAFRTKIKNTDGTLTDLPIAAETAKQLKSSRSIGLSGVVATSRSFNGTSAITIPVTAVPAKLITGAEDLNVGSAKTATNLSKEWIIITPGQTVIPYGTYLIKVDIADGSSGIGAHCTIITDIIDMQSDSRDFYPYRYYELPAGPIHTYCANNYESKWFRSARVQVCLATTPGFKIDLYVSPSGIYVTSNVTGAMLYPNTVASSLSGFTYRIQYKRLM